MTCCSAEHAHDLSPAAPFVVGVPGLPRLGALSVAVRQSRYDHRSADAAHYRRCPPPTRPPCVAATGGVGCRPGGAADRGQQQVGVSLGTRCTSCRPDSTSIGATPIPRSTSALSGPGPVGQRRRPRFADRAAAAVRHAGRAGGGHSHRTHRLRTRRPAARATTCQFVHGGPIRDVADRPPVRYDNDQPLLLGRRVLGRRARICAVATRADG